MDSSTKRAAKLSSCVHLTVLLVFITGAVYPLLQRKPDEHIFTLVDLPDRQDYSPRSAANAVSSPTESVEELTIEVPDFKPLPPAPEPVPPAPVKEPPPQKMVSYDEYIKKFGAPKEQKPTATPKKRAPVKVQSIDVSQLRKSLDVALSSQSDRDSVSRLSRAERNEIDRYKAHVRDLIQAAWDRPQGYVGSSLKAKVNLRVLQDGHITFISFIDSSGNPLFDQSIRYAFTRAGRAGPRPRDFPDTLSVTFLLEQ